MDEFYRRKPVQSDA
jgi:hypothetical protein